MTLAVAVAPLAAYAVVFQTLIYMALPAPLRLRIVPTVTGLVGAGLAFGAGLVFGFDSIGVTGVDPSVAVGWGALTVVAAGLVGAAMMSRSTWRLQLADPRIGSLGRHDSRVHILIRIPVFTALIEELVFRGVLHGALVALYPTEVALWLGAGLFGLWHIGPGLDQAQAGEKSPQAKLLHTVGTVAGTTLAGAFLVWLRIETGSIWAPVAVHAAINMTMAGFARLAARRVVPLTP
jgi:uncharacterized protein